MKIEKLMALYGENGALLEELYNQYKLNPETLDKEWKSFFQEVDTNGLANGSGYTNGNGKSAVATLLRMHRRLLSEKWGLSTFSMLIEDKVTLPQN